METKEYTISVLTEDKPGLLNKLTIILNRKKINIQSLNVSTTEIAGVSRYTLVVEESREELLKIVQQIRKLIDVLGAFLYEENEVYYKEIALYKLSLDAFKKSGAIESILKKYSASILAIEDDQIVLEKTGSKQDTHQLYEALEPFGILEFVRSGRVALSKSKRKTEAFIHELETSNSNELSIKEF